MKRILSVLFVPLLALSALFGCSKITYNSNVLSSEFNAYIDSYIKDGKNLMFKNNLLPASNENNEGDYYLDGESYLPTYEKIMYITYDNSYGLNDALYSNANSKIKIQTNQLHTVYQRLLSLIFNYYSNWSANFYAVIKDTNITQKEWEKFSDDLHNLKQTTDQFVERKKDLEREVKMANGVNGGLVEANLNAFNSYYNKLILSSLQFVNTFKDLHKKYIFTSNDITPSATKRLVDEALLLVAEAIFYDNVLAFEKNDVTEIYTLKTQYANSNYVWITKPVWNDVVVSTSKGTYANSNIKAKVNNTTSHTIENSIVNQEIDEEIRNLAREKVKQLYLYVESFSQNLNHYKQIFAKTNLNNYNAKRQLVDVVSNFDFDKLSVQEKTNITFLCNFSYNRIGTMFASLFQVVDKNA